MALDPRIPLGVVTQDQIVQQNQNQLLNQAKLDDLPRQRAREDRADALTGQANQLALKKAEIDQARTDLDFQYNLVASSVDPVSYSTNRQKAIQMFGPEAAQRIPEQYDPQLIQQMGMGLLSAKERIDAAAKALDDTLARDKFAEDKRHNLATEGKKSEGMSVTLPDGTVMQVGGSGKMTEAQGQASSRGTLLGNGLQTIDANIASPNVNPYRQAAADTIQGMGAPGRLVATKIRSDEENMLNAGNAGALEGVASAVTGAGVTKDQFDRFTSMLPNSADSGDVRAQKFKSALTFLENQLQVAGPRGQQILATDTGLQQLMQKYGVGQSVTGGVGAVGAANNVGRTTTNAQSLEGKTATNPTTGQKIIYRNGQWQAL